jgi:uncharacterized GH25 family protein
MTVYSNKLSVNVNSNTVSNTGLEITNYKVSVLCQPGPVVNSHQISVSGTVLYNGNPVPNVPVYFGFCSYYDPITHVLSSHWATQTDQNGNFSSNAMYTETPPGGGNCVVAVVYYNNMYADKEMNVTVPWC